MKIKKKKLLLYGLICLFLLGIFLQQLSKNSTQAAVNNSQSEHSGGFVITAEKLEGTIDLVRAFFGNVTLAEGKIHGLQITKSLNTGQFGKMNLNYSSPGPITVFNLSVKTIDEKMPQFTGFCQPSSNNWICLENVTMTVTSQSVKDIALPNLTIASCFESNCPVKEIENPEPDEQKVQELKQLIETKPESEKMILSFLQKASQTGQIKGSADLVDQLIKLLKGETATNDEAVPQQEDSSAEKTKEQNEHTEQSDGNGPEQQDLAPNQEQRETPEQERSSKENKNRESDSADIETSHKNHNNQRINL